jgi:hypothetical protein
VIKDVHRVSQEPRRLHEEWGSPIPGTSGGGERALFPGDSSRREVGVRFCGNARSGRNPTALLDLRALCLGMSVAAGTDRRRGVARMNQAVSAIADSSNAAD